MIASEKGFTMIDNAVFPVLKNVRLKTAAIETDGYSQQKQLGFNFKQNIEIELQEWMSGGGEGISEIKVVVVVKIDFSVKEEGSTAPFQTGGATYHGEFEFPSGTALADAEKVLPDTDYQRTLIQQVFPAIVLRFRDLVSQTGLSPPPLSLMPLPPSLNES